MKIGFLITARLKSSRLPLKILMDLNGKTVIERIIDRAKAVKGISEIVLCTSTNPQDKPLVDIAKDNNIYYYNGHEDDVLQRLKDAATFFSFDYVVSITADNPLFSIYHSNLIVDRVRETKCDFVKVTGLPLGCATSGINTKALEVVCEIKNIINTEIWGSLLDRPDIFQVQEICVTGKFKNENYRLTLDYPEDYELISNIYSNVTFNDAMNLISVIEYLDNNPKLASINRDCVQLYPEKEFLQKVEALFKHQKQEVLSLKNEIYETQV